MKKQGLDSTLRQFIALISITDGYKLDLQRGDLEGIMDAAIRLMYHSGITLTLQNISSFLSDIAENPKKHLCDRLNQLPCEQAAIAKLSLSFMNDAYYKECLSYLCSKLQERLSNGLSRYMIYIENQLLQMDAWNFKIL